MFKKVVLASAVATSMAAPEFRVAPEGRGIAGQYIVRLRNTENLEALKAHVDNIKTALGSEAENLEVFNNLASHGFVGYSVTLSKRAVDFLLNRSEVFSIEEDQIVTIDTCVSQSKPDWGLARINERNYTSTGTYTYDYTSGATGAGVDAYILDTGIYCENGEFTKKKTGTCKFGYSSVKKSGTTDTTDGNGHGTHCAGTVAGQTYGIAKEANLIAVKVMSDAGSGSSAGIIAGIDWVVGQVKSTKKPSVANMSLGGSYSEDENAAVEAAVDAGIVFVVAAGNDGKDACKYSPASAPSVITVAASEKSNKRASYSNYGSCVDIFGPGTDITSAWIDSPSATKTISGTSMASPHLCGVAAVYLSANKNQTPEEVTRKILETATPNQITDVKGSPNLVAYSAC